MEKDQKFNLLKFIICSKTARKEIIGPKTGLVIRRVLGSVHAGSVVTDLATLVINSFIIIYNIDHIFSCYIGLIAFRSNFCKILLLSSAFLNFLIFRMTPLLPTLSLNYNMSRRSKKIEKQLTTCHSCQVIFSSIDAYLHSEENCQACVDLYQKYSLSAPHGYVWGNVFIAQIKVQQQEKNKVKKGNENDDRRKNLVKLFDFAK